MGKIDTLKRAIKKNVVDGMSVDAALQTFLSVYRCTPNKRTPDAKSPAKIMLGRPIKF